MQGYTPIFPIVDLTTRDASGSQEDYDNGPSIHEATYMEQLSRRHDDLATLPDELSPPSCPSSPQTESRSELFRDKLLDAVNATNGQPSNPKWGLVHRMLRMACTSRGYRGAASGTRVGGSSSTDVRDYKWILPDTEQQWLRCEERWKRCLRVADQHPEQASNPRAKDAYGDDWPQSRSQRIREKVEHWQAQLITVEETQSSLHDDNSEPKAASPKEVLAPIANSRQTALLFPVSKHGVSGTKGGPPRDALPVDPQLPTSSLMEVDEPTPEVQEVEPPDQGSLARKTEQPTANIADVSEMSFLPPSFPTHLQTSTPKDEIPKDKPPTNREKPPPIYPRLFPSSSPVSTPFAHSPLPNQDGDQPDAPLPSSSSLPTHSVQLNLKRQRPLTPPDHDPFISREDSPVTKQKKADVSSDRPPGLGLVPSPSSVAFPPSSPPSVSLTPPRSRSQSPQHVAPLRSKDLGNANGLPVPSTPDRNKALPTLSQLLASSRRSRPRPRPPSRKLKSLTSTPSRNGPRMPEQNGANHPLSVNQEEEDAFPEVIVNPRTPSPVRTFFSSPASGSSDSTPQSIRQKRLGSPVSPLVHSGLHMDRFNPPFTSTQRQNEEVAHQTENVARNAWAPSAFGTGFLGYSSQFDVDRHVDEVNELLERDVDFDGWLKDIPEVDGDDIDEGRGRPPPTQDSVGI